MKKAAVSNSQMCVSWCAKCEITNFGKKKSGEPFKEKLNVIARPDKWKVTTLIWRGMKYLFFLQHFIAPDLD